MNNLNHPQDTLESEDPHPQDAQEPQDSVDPEEPQEPQEPQDKVYNPAPYFIFTFIWDIFAIFWSHLRQNSLRPNYCVYIYLPF